MNVVEFVNYCLHHNLPYEMGRNWCDCVDYTTFVNFWVDGRVHTFYVFDNGTFKIDNTVVSNIKDVEEVISKYEVAR